MGIFDFFKNMKNKAAEKGLDKAAKKLVDKYAAPVAKVVRERFEGGQVAEDAVKDFIKDQAMGLLEEQARPHIPGPLQAQAGQIIEIAVDKMVDIVYDQVKAQLSIV